MVGKVDRSRLLSTLTGIIERHNRAMTELGHVASRHCTAGCARCCAMIFFVSPAEVAVIAAHLRRHSELLDDFLRLNVERERCRREHEELWRACQRARMGDDPALKAWYALDIRCAFNRDGFCTIYPVRPLSCSLYNSVVPAEVCAVEPKSYESEAMRARHGATRQQLAEVAAPHLTGGEVRLDVSYLVAQALSAEEP